MPIPTLRAARACASILCFASSMAHGEHVVTSDSVDLPLAVVADGTPHAGPNDLRAWASLRQEDGALGISVHVVDDELVFAEGAVTGDRIEVVLAPPQNPYFDHPDNYFHSELLNTRYWFPDEQVEEVVAREGWIHDTWDMPNSCYGGNGQPAFDQAALLQRAPLRMGQVHYVFNPFTGQVAPHQPDPSGGMRVTELAAQVQVVELALTDDGYRVDVIDVDSGDDRPTLASTSSRADDASPVHFESLRLEPALSFRPDPRLPFLGTPAELDAHGRALQERAPPYFLWSGLEWSAARIGQMPGDERGHDYCTAGIGYQMMAHEAELLVGPLAYADFDVPDRAVTAFEGHLIVDGEHVYTPRGDVRHVFELDADTLAVIDAYERPDRGRFSRGPCAAASSQSTDLVVISDAGTSRHPLHSQSTCSSWPDINGEAVADETEHLFDPPLDVDAATRTLTLTGGRFDHVWTLTQTDGAWRPDYRRVDKPAPARPMAVRLSEPSSLHEYEQIDTDTYMARFGEIVGPGGAHLADRSLEQVVCDMARGATPLDLRLALANFAGGTPDCMIPDWTRLPQYIDEADPQAERLRAELDALLEDWRPEPDRALHIAADYLVGGALLDDPDDGAVREIAFEIARRTLDHVTTWETPRRHTETQYRSQLFGAVRTAVPRTWDILLDWADEPDEADPLVETALAHYIMQDDRERFDALVDRHELPGSSYLYLLMIAADRPDYAQALLGKGVDWTDRFEDGDTLLHHVAAWRNAPPDWIAPLADAGVDPNATDAEGLTALQLLYGKIIRGYQGDHESLRDKARALVAAGARLEGLDTGGHGLLWHALNKEAAHGRNKPSMFAGPLLEAGIDVDRIDSSGQSALHHAVDLGIDWMIAPLIEHGADPNVADARGATPLMRALYSAQTDVARQLLEVGANTDLRDQDGRRACDYIGQSLSGNPARLHALHRDYGCSGTPPRPWPTLWPTSGACSEPPIVYSSKDDDRWRWNLHRIRPDGSDGRRVLAGGSQPIAWLRVAATLGHVGYSDEGDAHILPCGETDPTRVRKDAYFLDWYPGGERILVAGHDRSLCDLHVDGSTNCFGRSTGMSVDISPDGTHLTTNYSAHLPVIHDLAQRKTRYLLDSATTDTREQNLQPRFLPDGKSISYIHRIDDEHWQLLVGSPGANIFNVVLEGDVGLWKYAWSPDGRQVIHTRGAAARSSLVIHYRATGESRVLVASEQTFAAVDWMWLRADLDRPQVLLSAHVGRMCPVTQSAARDGTQAEQ